MGVHLVLNEKVVSLSRVNAMDILYSPCHGLQCIERRCERVYDTPALIPEVSSSDHASPVIPQRLRGFVQYDHGDF